ncbi:LCP family protein [Patescibacteria group bacterium]
MQENIEDKDLSLNNTSKKPRRRLVFFLMAIPVLAILSSIFIVAWWYSSAFAQAGNISQNELSSSIKQGLNHDFFQSQMNHNVLILGMDQIGQNRNGSLLTDTIIVANLSRGGKINLISVPRDLWINSLKTKINALYYYGEKDPHITGEELMKKSLEEITGQSISHTITLNLETVRKIIDSIGGVQVDVEMGFVDEKYPKDDVDPNILPIELRYETVAFNKGKQEMDGNTALKFIRSRQSQNEDENTDISRSKRQQKIIFSIISKLKSKEIILNPSVMGALYKVWQEEVNSSLFLKDLVSLGKAFATENVSLNQIGIPVKSDTEDGIMYNPPANKYKQWVYEPVDPTWTEFQEFFEKNLN